MSVNHLNAEERSTALAEDRDRDATHRRDGSPKRPPARGRAGAKKEDREGDQGMVIPAIEPKILVLDVVGTTPLVVCAWSEKAKRQIRDKQMKKAKQAKDAKDPQADYLASRYVSTGGWDGVPAGGVKGCLVNACRAVDGLPMTLAKRMVFVKSDGFTESGIELVRIHGEPEMHEGMVRIDSGGTTDIRYRAMYRKWSLQLQIEYLANVISAEQIGNLVELAGYIEGLCEHRPGAPKSNTGNWGRFRVKRDDD